MLPFRSLFIFARFINKRSLKHLLMSMYYIFYNTGYAEAYCYADYLIMPYIAYQYSYGKPFVVFSEYKGKIPRGLQKNKKKPYKKGIFLSYKAVICYCLIQRIYQHQYKPYGFKIYH